MESSSTNPDDDCTEDSTWTDVFETYHGIEAPKPHLEFVENLIDLLLLDPRFNILVLPDYLEKQIYRSVIYMLLETLMSSVWNLNGLRLLHHEIELELIYDNIPISISNLETVDIRAIESLIDELLKDNTINIAWLPDSIEKSLYTTILFLIFTVIEVIASSIEINLIGHALRLSFGPNGEGFEKLHEKFKSTLSNAQSPSSRSQAWRSTTTKETPAKRIQLIEEIAEKAIEDGKREREKQINSDEQQTGYSYMPYVAEKALYVTIYSMILCVVEEVFDSMHVRILGDLVLLKLVPAYDESDNKLVIAQKIKEEEKVVKVVKNIVVVVGYKEKHLLFALLTGFILNFICVIYYFETIIFYYCP